MLEGTIQQELERQSLIDLKAPVEEEKAIILAEVAKPHDGMIINIGNPLLGVGRIGIGAER